MQYTVIFAGGVGARMGSPVPKQFLEVDGIPVIIHTVRQFDAHPEIDGIVVVCNADYLTYCRDLVQKFGLKKVCAVIPGGATGQLSIREGLSYLIREVSKQPAEDIVLIHDGVRPVISQKLISEAIACVKTYGNCVTCSDAIETVICVDEDGQVREVLDRSECRNAKAPQCFYLQEIWEAHEKAYAENIRNSIDSATLMSSFGCRLHTITCGPENIKITTPNDFYMFEALYYGGARALREGQHVPDSGADEHI